jgi:hypothetical protein
MHHFELDRVRRRVGLSNLIRYTTRRGQELWHTSLVAQRRGVVMKAVVLSLLILALVHPSAAQQKPELQVVVEDLDPVAATCGITMDLVRSSVVLTLRQNGIEVATGRTAPLLLVGASILHLPGPSACVAVISVQVSAFQAPVQRGRFRAIEPEDVALCRSGYVFVSNKSSFPKNFSEEIEALTKICLSKLKY